MNRDKPHLSQSLEDYLEAIYVVSREKNVARVKDLVTKLKVRSSSVIGALKKLRERGYVNQEHYGYIELTEKGLDRARELFEKHNSLFHFFSSILKVDHDIAEKDACAIEHHISEETYSRMMKLIGIIERSSESKDKLYEELHNFISRKD